MTNNITLSQLDDIAIVSMDNGGRANTIDLALCEGLLDALGDIERSTMYRAMILRATGGLFSAGGDLPQILAALDQHNGFLESLISTFHFAILALRRLRIPVIASVHGTAAGGGFSLAMASDVIVASSKARFIVGYPKLGTSSDGGLSFQLARRLGVARALDVFLLKGSLSVEEACSLGLVQRITAPSSLEDTALALARKFASYPLAAVAEIKSLVGMGADDELERHLEREKQAFLRCASTAEFRARVAQFVAQSRASTAPGPE
ncbi:enoyl-CoA hydratase/isomerase family protein [Paraburkholderia sp. D1E]|uniref:enoyl-CoA hydratase/isomerase family protein n=1 Tax=Paraburkholderia sp. D1E TaxID=3461398 RepID=UPI00404554D8